MMFAACLALGLQWAPEATDLTNRALVCHAILAATRDDREQRWLLVVAAEESTFRTRVLDCAWRGDGGKARGPWQVHARSAHEARALCAPDAESARIALGRILESEGRCRFGKPEHRHANYAGTSCASRAGRRISARRYELVAASLKGTDT